VAPSSDISDPLAEEAVFVRGRRLALAREQALVLVRVRRLERVVAAGVALAVRSG